MTMQDKTVPGSTSKQGGSPIPSSDPVHVVVCGDRNVLWGIAVTIRSALESASGPLAITILESGFSDADRAALEASWQHPNAHSIEFHSLDYNKIRNFRSTSYLKSKVAYARYYIDDVIPAADKCIYLDSDLIVMRDLHEAAAIDLGNAIAGVVLDVSTRTNDGQVELCRKLGIANHGGYFNSGFLIIDLNRYREEKIQEKLVDVSIRLFDKLDSQDQAALNIVLEGKTLILDVVWNVSQYEVDYSARNVILHLIGKVKPWHGDYDYIFKDLFFSYLDRTAYKGCRPHALSAVSARISRKLPTHDMVIGKFRRLFKKTV